MPEAERVAVERFRACDVVADDRDLADSGAVEGGHGEIVGRPGGLGNEPPLRKKLGHPKMAHMAIHDLDSEPPPRASGPTAEFTGEHPGDPALAAFGRRITHIAFEHNLIIVRKGDNTRPSALL